MRQLLICRFVAWEQTPFTSILLRKLDKSQKRLSLSMSIPTLRLPLAVCDHFAEPTLHPERDICRTGSWFRDMPEPEGANTPTSTALMTLRWNAFTIRS